MTTPQHLPVNQFIRQDDYTLTRRLLGLALIATVAFIWEMRQGWFRKLHILPPQRK